MQNTAFTGNSASILLLNETMIMKPSSDTGIPQSNDSGYCRKSPRKSLGGPILVESLHESRRDVRFSSKVAGKVAGMFDSRQTVSAHIAGMSDSGRRFPQLSPKLPAADGSFRELYGRIHSDRNGCHTRCLFINLIH